MANMLKRGITSIPVFLVLVALIFIWRRPDQFLHPYIWVEEGSVTLPAYLEHGWRSLWEPVAGYLILPSKLIFLCSASLSFTHLPRIEYWLTLIFEVGTVALIAYSPTHLRFPRLAALAVVLLPTDSEVFSGSAYAFWWGSLWSFVAVFWRQVDRPRTGWRCLLVLVGGLSSPMALPAAALLAFRAAVIRKREDVVIMLTGVVTAAIQWHAMKHAGAMGRANLHELSPALVVGRFFGQYVLGISAIPFVLMVCVGAAILLGGSVYFVLRGKWRDPWCLMLAACLLTAVAASVTRVSVEIINPVWGGPRYFFYPFIFLSWMLLYAYAEVPAWAKASLAMVLALAFAQGATHWQRRHDRISWRGEVKACIAGGDTIHKMPIHTTGYATMAWTVPMTGQQCKALVDRGLFR